MFSKQDGEKEKQEKRHRAPELRELFHHLARQGTHLKPHTARVEEIFTEKGGKDNDDREKNGGKMIVFPLCFKNHPSK